MIDRLPSLLHSFRAFIRNRLQNYFLVQQQENAGDASFDFSDEVKLEVIQMNHRLLSGEETIVLLLALMPHLQPNFFESIIQEFLPQGGDFTEFGGVKGGNHRSMMPTGDTALFLLAGNDLQQRLKVRQFFSEEHFFNKEKILWIEDVKEGEPLMSGRIILSPEWIEKWMYGKISKPRFSQEFPARCINTLMNWDDAVLHSQTRQQIEVMATWLAHNRELMQDENLSRKLKPGYRVLFYGPSGTGKTLTASLLGKQFQKDAYRIDLSQIVSKYIGETEKNLEKVFSRAEDKDWILFFDEADALFGKRTSVQSSHDKYANQEVSYLLQRVEDFPGLLILASNFKNNIDAAFLRRFHQIIHFPMPNAEERFLLWKKALPHRMQLHPETNLHHLAEKYEITGAAIMNVMQYAALQSIRRKDYLLQQHDFIEGIRRELQKEEKSV